MTPGKGHEMNSLRKYFQVKTQSSSESLSRLCLNLIILTAASLLGPTQLLAQQPTETIRINTRVVFMDALVKDKRTGASISDLAPENFEVFDDGRLHQLDVRVKAVDAKGKTRKLLISSRKGYFFPKLDTAETATSRNQ